MATQVNIKLDAKLKEQAEQLAQRLGFSLSSVMRAFLLQFVRLRRIDFSLEEEGNTSADLTGKKLEKALIAEGEDPAYAKRHGDAYDAMLEDEKMGRLIEIK